MKFAPAPPASFTLYLAGPEAPAQKERLFEFGQYWLWGSSISPEAPRLTVIEKLPEGLVEAYKPGYFLHLIKAGVPHHIVHLFGYWYSGDADGVWLQVEREDATTYAWIIGGRRRVKRAHRFAWICQRCGTMLAEQHHTDPDGRLETFLSAQLVALRQFNGDPARTCRSCGHDHPLAYGLDPKSDLPEESAARAAW